MGRGWEVWNLEQRAHGESGSPLEALGLSSMPMRTLGNFPLC